MKTLLISLLICCAAEHAVAVRISAPGGGISHPRAEPHAETPHSRKGSADWEPNDTRRPRTGQSGWQYTPSNKWRAPRDAQAEKRREYDRIRRQNATPRLRID